MRIMRVEEALIHDTALFVLFNTGFRLQMTRNALHANYCSFLVSADSQENVVDMVLWNLRCGCSHKELIVLV